MAAFFEKLRLPRGGDSVHRHQQQQKQHGQGEPSRWAGAAGSLRVYVSRVQRLQGDVRREMGFWLDGLSSESEVLHAELQTHVDAAKRRLGTTLNGLEIHLHQALHAAKGKLGVGEDCEYAPPTLRRQDQPASQMDPETDRDREHPEQAESETVSLMTEEGSSTPSQQQHSRVTHATAVDAACDARDPPGSPPPEGSTQDPSPLNHRASPRRSVFPSPAAARTAPLMGPITPPTLQGRTSTAVAESLSTSSVARGKAMADSASSGSAGDLAESATGSGRKEGIASFKTASMRIGRAIQSEEWVGNPPPGAMAGDAPDMSEEMRQREAQLLADWLADR